MPVAQKIALLDSVLQRAADRLGDITKPVMERYYHDQPAARASFAALGDGDSARLEGNMVEMVLYCAMTWLERPQEIALIFGNTVPHHLQTLGIEAAWFSALIDAVAAVIAETIPADAASERALWHDVARDLRGIAGAALPV